MNSYDMINMLRKAGRVLEAAQPDDATLGPLSQLPGQWKNLPALPGSGWNMIALPFAGPLHYRVLVNQYNEEHKFDLVDKGVPNRGINIDGNNVTEQDQTVVTMDYEQTIHQVKADDFPQSGMAGAPGLAIHHEPGLVLHMLDQRTEDFDIARLATIPHGDSVLAMGRSAVYEGAPKIPEISGLPIGLGNNDLETSGYLAPYKHYNDNLFEGIFNPVKPNELLEKANQGVNIVKTTELHFDTTFATGGIVNIPFIVKQANATEMKATFWIQELEEKDKEGNPKLRLQYSQTVFLDFFDRTDGEEGLIRWPHVSINTMEKVQ